MLITAGDNAGVALRGLFIISPEGVLRQKTVNDLPVGRSVDETLRLLQAFQFTVRASRVQPRPWSINDSWSIIDRSIEAENMTKPTDLRTCKPTDQPTTHRSPLVYTMNRRRTSTARCARPTGRPARTR